MLRYPLQSTSAIAGWGRESEINQTRARSASHPRPCAMRTYRTHNNNNKKGPRPYMRCASHAYQKTIIPENFCSNPSRIPSDPVVHRPRHRVPVKRSSTRIWVSLSLFILPQPEKSAHLPDLPRPSLFRCACVHRFSILVRVLGEVISLISSRVAETNGVYLYTYIRIRTVPIFLIHTHDNMRYRGGRGTILKWSWRLLPARALALARLGNEKDERV